MNGWFRKNALGEYLMGLHYFEDDDGKLSDIRNIPDALENIERASKVNRMNVRFTCDCCNGKIAISRPRLRWEDSSHFRVSEVRQFNQAIPGWPLYNLICDNCHYETMLGKTFNAISMFKKED